MIPAFMFGQAFSSRLHWADSLRERESIKKKGVTILEKKTVLFARSDDTCRSKQTALVRPADDNTKQHDHHHRSSCDVFTSCFAWCASGYFITFQSKCGQNIFKKKKKVPQISPVSSLSCSVLRLICVMRWVVWWWDWWLLCDHWHTFAFCWLWKWPAFPWSISWTTLALRMLSNYTTVVFLSLIFQSDPSFVLCCVENE